MRNNMQKNENINLEINLDEVSMSENYDLLISDDVNAEDVQNILATFLAELRRVNQIYSAVVENCLQYDVVALPVISETLEDIGNAYLGYSEELTSHYRKSKMYQGTFS